MESQTRGYIMVIIGASLWGLSGTAAQDLFHSYGFQPVWLVEIRMLFSGVLLLMIYRLLLPDNPALRNMGWKDVLSMVIFGIAGLLAVQLAYFMTIDYSNAGTATLLQYVAPFFIMVWLVLTGSKRVYAFELVSVLVAMSGLFLLLTDGSVTGIKVSYLAIYWGIGSALAAAFYTVYPYRLIGRFNTFLVTGLGMIFGSLVLMPIYYPWSLSGFSINAVSVSLVIFVILLGTALPFMLYIGSLRHISPSSASILSVFEPLSAVAATVLLLGTRLGGFQIAGGVLIVVSTVIISAKGGISRPASGSAR